MNVTEIHLNFREPSSGALKTNDEGHPLTVEETQNTLVQKTGLTPELLSEIGLSLLNILNEWNHLEVNGNSVTFTLGIKPTEQNPDDKKGSCCRLVFNHVPI